MELTGDDSVACNSLSIVFLVTEGVRMYKEDEGVLLSTFASSRSQLNPKHHSVCSDSTHLVMNGAQRCEMQNRAVYRWVGGLACRVLLLPFWSKATQRATFKGGGPEHDLKRLPWYCLSARAPSANGGVRRLAYLSLLVSLLRASSSRGPLPVGDPSRT